MGTLIHQDEVEETTTDDTVVAEEVEESTFDLEDDE